jgi:restriction endonuclease Mrr
MRRGLESARRSLEADRFARVDELLDILADRSKRLSGIEAEQHLAYVLKALLIADGYDMHHNFNYIGTAGAGDSGIDYGIYVNNKDIGVSQSVGIQFKYYRNNKITVEQVRSFMSASQTQGYERAAFITTSDFTRGAKEFVEKHAPAKVELIGISELKNWVASIRYDWSHEDKSAEEFVRICMRALHEKFALLIARNVESLRVLEWRQLEEIMAEVFHGLGFNVVLTPCSKDGGKDIVLNYHVNGRSASYYVEVKHWRSNTKVNSEIVSDFMRVIIRDKQAGGLLLSTYGFNGNAFEGLTEVDRHMLHFGDKHKIVSLCRFYEKSKRGLWSAPYNLGGLISS